MKTILNTAFNIWKIVYWIFLLVTFVGYFGLVYGSLLFAAVTFVWNIAATLIRYYRLSGFASYRELLHIMFSTAVTLPFTVYGCYCSPTYGVDGRSNGFAPIDELDNACREHDNLMLAANYQLASGDLTKKGYTKLKNTGDWLLMRRAIVSRNSATGIYLLGLEVGFLLRILGRTINRA
jgi:hypothetical protein